MKPADFLDDEPLMLKGCTGSELSFVIVVAVIAWLLLSALLSFCTLEHIYRAYHVYDYDTSYGVDSCHLV